MRALITGVCGFTGAHLARYLTRAGDDVVGMDLPDAPTERLEDTVDGIHLVHADLSNEDAMLALVVETEPDVIYHLAALSGGQRLEEMLVANVVGTRNVLEGAAHSSTSPRVMLVSSAAVYGRVPVSEQPIKEEARLHPVTAYGLSKAAMELLGWAYEAEREVPVVVARTFNLLGADSPVERLVGAVQWQLAEITGGTRLPVLQLGDLSAERDYIDVSEAVEAYRLIATAGEVGTAYNVCAGEALPVLAIVERLISEAGLEGVTIAMDAARLRVSDVDVSVGDPSRLRALKASSAGG